MRITVFAAMIALAACGQATEPLVVETPLPPSALDAATDMPLRLADSEADLDAMAEQALGSVNPLENDLSDLEVAVRLRDAFQISDSGVNFELKVIDGEGDVPIEEKVQLVETSGVTSPQLAAAARDGFYIRTFKLSELDQLKFGAAYNILQAMKAESTGNNQLTFNATAHSCVDPSAEPPQQYSLTMFVRTHPDVDFVTLSDEWVVDRGSEGLAAQIFQLCGS